MHETLNPQICMEKNLTYLNIERMTPVIEHLFGHPLTIYTEDEGSTCFAFYTKQLYQTAQEVHKNLMLLAKQYGIELAQTDCTGLHATLTALLPRFQEKFDTQGDLEQLNRLLFLLFARQDPSMLLSLTQYFTIAKVLNDGHHLKDIEACIATLMDHPIHYADTIAGFISSHCLFENSTRSQLEYARDLDKALKNKDTVKCVDLMTDVLAEMFLHVLNSDVRRDVANGVYKNFADIMKKVCLGEQTPDDSSKSQCP